MFVQFVCVEIYLSALFILFMQNSNFFVNL